MSLADSFGVIGPDCKHAVNISSSEVFTRHLNKMFTVACVKAPKTPDPIGEFALNRAKKMYGNTARFSVALFGEDKRQQVNQWRWRGVPAARQFNVAKKLDLTVEELLAAGRLPISESPLPPEAIEFAREWMDLPALIRSQIQSLIRALPKELGRIDGETRVERPPLQRSGRA